MENKPAHSDPAAAFREKFQRETGESALMLSPAEWLRAREGDRGVSGLLILTDRSLHFREMGADSWLVELVRAHQAERTDDRHEMSIPLHDITGLSEIRPGLLERLFGQGGQCLLVTTTGGGESFRLASLRDFLPALERQTKNATPPRS